MASSKVKKEKKWTHSELCTLAVRWLQKSHSQSGPGCTLAVSEVRSGYSGEIPDAIGFRCSGEASTDGSYMVECKASRSDFLADFKKEHRQESTGNFRYYLAPAGVIKLEELPAGWGLLEPTSRGSIKVICGSVAESQKNWYLGEKDLIASSKRRDEAIQAWRQPGNPQREQWILVHLFKKIGDPEKSNKVFKEMLNRFNQLVLRYEEQRSEIVSLRNQLVRYRYGLEEMMKEGIPDLPASSRQFGQTPLSKHLEEYIENHDLPQLKLPKPVESKKGWEGF